MQGRTSLVSTVVRFSLPSSIDTSVDSLIDISAIIIDTMNDIRPGHKNMTRPPVSRPMRCYSIARENGRIKFGGELAAIDPNTQRPVHLAKTYKELGLPHRRMVDVKSGCEYTWSRGVFAVVDANGNSREVRLPDTFVDFELEFWNHDKQYPQGSGIRRVVRDSRTVFADRTPPDVQQAAREMEESLACQKPTEEFSWPAAMPIYALVSDASTLNYDEAMVDREVLLIATGKSFLTLQRSEFNATIHPKFKPGVDPATATEEDVTGYRLIDADGLIRDVRTRMPGFVFRKFRGTVEVNEVLQIVADDSLYLTPAEFKARQPEAYNYIRGQLLREFVLPYGEQYMVDINLLTTIPDACRLVVSVFKPFTVVLPPQMFSGQYSVEMLRSTPLATTTKHLDVDLVSLPAAWTARRSPRPSAPANGGGTYHAARQQSSQRRTGPASDFGTVIPEANRPGERTERFAIPYSATKVESTETLLKAAEAAGLTEEDEFAASMDAAITDALETLGNVPETRDAGSSQHLVIDETALVTENVTPGTSID